MIDIQRHKTIMLQILKDIYSDISIAPILGFKGGTACFLFYKLPRFSVDLDFNLLDLDKSELVFNKIETIISKYGRIKDKHKKRNTLLFELSYEDDKWNIKIEISLLNFGSTYEIKNYLGLSILIMKKEDIFANKLVALLERKQMANRDLYDIWFFLNNRWDINEKIIQVCTGMKLNDYLQKVIKEISTNKQGLLAGLGELLDKEQKNFARKKLKDELLFLLKLRLEQNS